MIWEEKYDKSLSKRTHNYPFYLEKCKSYFYDLSNIKKNSLSIENANTILLCLLSSKLLH